MSDIPPEVHVGNAKDIVNWKLKIDDLDFTKEGYGNPKIIRGFYDTTLVGMVVKPREIDPDFHRLDCHNDTLFEETKKRLGELGKLGLGVSDSINIVGAQNLKVIFCYTDDVKSEAGRRLAFGNCTRNLEKERVAKRKNEGDEYRRSVGLAPK